MQELKEAKKSFTVMCRKMDQDHDGELTLEDVREGYKTMTEFGTFLKILGISEPDLFQLFEVMDHDHSGSVTTEEFVKECPQLQCTDIASVALYIRMFMNKIHTQISDSLETGLKEIKEVHYELAKVDKDIKKVDCELIKVDRDLSKVDSHIEKVDKDLLQVDQDTMAALEAVRASLEGNGASDEDAVKRWTIGTSPAEFARGSLPAGETLVNSNSVLKKLEDIDNVCKVKLTSIEKAMQDLTSQMRIDCSIASSVEELRSLIASCQLSVSSHSSLVLSTPSIPLVDQGPKPGDDVSNNLPSRLGRCLCTLPRPVTPRQQIASDSRILDSNGHQLKP
jgi:hypothetical protein